MNRFRSVKSLKAKNISPFSTSSLNDRDVVVCSFARTPITKLNGELSSMTAPRLGAHVIKAALQRSGLDKNLIEEAFMGNVVSAGIGQAPSRQAVIYGGLPLSVPTTDINKVCAAGMKAVMLASLSITSGYRDVCIAGGMESMSNVPHYLLGSRKGFRMGHVEMKDGVIHDGLWDVYNNQHMGMCGEACSKQFNISREEQDQFSFESYRRTAEAWSTGKYTAEVAPVTLPPAKKGGKETIISVDEEFSSLGNSPMTLEKISAMRPAFKSDGVVTAGNASKINDGAAAMVITSGKFAKDHNLTPLFRVLSMGDAARDPVEFTIAPSYAVPLALKRVGMSMKDIEYHEINEAFAVVALANMKLMNLDPSRVNVNGGAVAMGHPVGMSGARIIGSLYHILKDRNATIGCASICNGGGGASAVIIERLN